MSIASFVISFLLIRFLRRSLQTAVRMPQWDRLLLGGSYFAILLLATEMFFSFDHITHWIWHILLLLLVGVAFTFREVRLIQTVLFAVLPFILASLLDDIIRLLAGDDYEVFDPYLSSAKAFSIIWMFALWISTQKQQKALEKERLKREAEEERNRLIALQKADLEQLVAERTAELTLQKEELQQTLTELKTTQAQLVQREKLASLGDLTAGIAHEIQNPLNFVNNFSEVSTELIEELEEELAAGHAEDAIRLAGTIKHNLEKIAHNGKRADSIVKGMLQHSRSSTGQKEPTDINALADEYLRLSYHGMRAKNKDFCARLVTEFQPDLDRIAVVPQELGRVLLNLCNNAFYATLQKKLLLNGTYQPEVRISTNCFNNQMEINIWDNGIGIPEKVKSKIFQPFFTTKPAGQGTGLGLSLSYDIITKGHEGTLQVETQEGEFTKFVIKLPVKN